MSKKQNTVLQMVQSGQGALDTFKTRQCACGCGVTFMMTAKEGRRQYLNDTHKKRAARQRAKTRQSEARVSLTAKGWVYLHGTDTDYEKQWQSMSDRERAIVQMLCDYALEPVAMLQEFDKLFPGLVAFWTRYQAPRYQREIVDSWHADINTDGDALDMSRYGDALAGEGI